ncbi:hypothetical protein EJ110_NYTH54343 [Nymphaea thermarum]|nr:hypothetical protein EJ110_NYTH54343 [Nymphaea thermarum]
MDPEAAARIPKWNESRGSADLEVSRIPMQRHGSQGDMDPEATRIPRRRMGCKRKTDAGTSTALSDDNFHDERSTKNALLQLRYFCVSIAFEHPKIYDRQIRQFTCHTHGNMMRVCLWVWYCLGVAVLTKQKEEEKETGGRKEEEEEEEGGRRMEEEKEERGSRRRSKSYLAAAGEAGLDCNMFSLSMISFFIQLCRKYPNLHVYSYGTLPCIDPVIADACSDFVTSIIYNDEFSARLSICSVLRLRAAAIAALAQDSSANSAMISKLARRILQTNQSHETGEKEIFSTPFTENLPAVDGNQAYRRWHYKYTTKGSEPVQDILIQEANAIVDVSTSEKFIDFFDENIYGTNHETRPYPGSTSDLFPSGDLLIHISDGESSTQPSKQEPQEVFLPGLIIHIIPESRKTFLALCKSWKCHGEDGNFRAYIASRETFKDLVVSPYMFLDHLPWRCHYALQRVLEGRGICGKLEDNFLCEGTLTRGVVVGERGAFGPLFWVDIIVLSCVRSSLPVKRRLIPKSQTNGNRIFALSPMLNSGDTAFHVSSMERKSAWEEEGGSLVLIFLREITSRFSPEILRLFRVSQATGRSICSHFPGIPSALPGTLSL